MKVAAKFNADASKRWLTLDYRPLELEQQVREFWEKHKVREKLEKEARERLRRGEKLPWEEFQLLAEKEAETQD